MEYLQSLFDTVQSIDFSNPKFLMNIAIACGIGLILGLAGRMFFGKRSELNHAVSSVFGILFLYLLGILLYGSSTQLGGLLSTLPFVAVQDGKIAVFVFSSARFSQACEMILQLVMLAFLVNLLDALLPRGKNVFTWLLLRLVTVLLSVFCQGLIVWLCTSVLPDSFLKYAPMILFIILCAAFLLGALKIVLGIALSAVNPVIGVLYTFFFSNLVGKQLSKAIMTTALLCGLVALLNKLGYVVISLAGLSAGILVPAVLILFAAWYLVHAVL